MDNRGPVVQQEDNGGWSGLLWKTAASSLHRRNQYRAYQLIYDTNTLADWDPEEKRGIVQTFDWL